MTILLDGSPAASLLPSDLINLPCIQRSAKEFQERDVRRVDAASAKSVCVLQSESAHVPWGACGVVGSTEATTCVMAFVVSRRGATVCHFDESTVTNEEYRVRMLDGLEGGEEAAVHLLGGYDDERDTGALVVQGIIDYLHRRPEKFRLETAMIGSLNTCQRSLGNRSYNAPRFTNACIDMQERALFPAEWADKGPLLTARQCRCMTGGAVTAVYDSARDAFVVTPWEYGLAKQAARFFQQVIDLDDKDMIFNVSTSPLVEGPEFCSDMRKCIDLMLSRPIGGTMMFPANKEQVFKWLDGRGWAAQDAVAGEEDLQ